MEGLVEVLLRERSGDCAGSHALKTVFEAHLSTAQHFLTNRRSLERKGSKELKSD